MTRTSGIEAYPAPPPGVLPPRCHGVNYYVKGDNLKLMAGVESSELDETASGTLKSTTVDGAVRMLY